MTNKTEFIRIQPEGKVALEYLAKKHEKSQTQYVTDLLLFAKKYGINIYLKSQADVPSMIKNLEQRIIGFMKKREQDLLIPMDTAVSRLPFVTINDAERNRFDNGQSVKGECSEPLSEGTSYRVYHGVDTNGIFLGVGEGVLDPKDQGIPKQEIFVNPKRRVVYS